MPHYQNSEIIERYGVSRRTVLNWIERAENGKLNLELQREKGRPFIAKTPNNQHLMTELAQRGRKYLNTNSLKTVVPNPEFYQLYTEEQILDIISHIRTYREIPLQYSYFNGGAEYWNRHTQQLYKDSEANPLLNTIELIDANMSYLDTILEKYAYINVIDVGVGNALPTKKLLSHLLKAGKLKRYAAIDISADMLRLAKKNIKAWFGDKVQFEEYVNDISFEPFADVIAEPPLKSGQQTINLVLLLGGTLANFRSPEDALKVIRKSMGPNDLFIYGLKLDSMTSRDQFDFRISGGGNYSLPPQCKFLIDLLGISEDYYSVEAGFDKEEHARYARIRMKYATNIIFSLSRGDWEVGLNKDDGIIVWWAKHNTSEEIVSLVSSNGFDPLLTSQTPTHDYMILLADLRKDGRQ